MPWRLVACLEVGALFALAACGPGDGASFQVPATSTSPVAASKAPTAGPSESSPRTSASPGASFCRQTDDPGAAVAVTIADFEFKPATIEARVGQIVAFSNTGFEPHNATTVDGGCGTKTLQTGESDALVFRLPGNYEFGCAIHRWMTGRFTIAP